jgi:hypothetical protein
MGVWEGKRGMITEEMGYRSFLLRLWCVKQNGELAWRASLEDPSTGQQYFFSSSDALNEFLRQLRQDLENEMDK